MSEYNDNLIYKPTEKTEPKALNAKLGVKFANDIFLMKSFLDQMGIKYDLEDLEDGPLGKGIRIKR